MLPPDRSGDFHRLLSAKIRFYVGLVGLLLCSLVAFFIALGITQFVASPLENRILEMAAIAFVVLLHCVISLLIHIRDITATCSAGSPGK
jgi:hypothetical protein